ncbi:hypothetical protein QUB29_09790 [Microcoleus sp. B4b_D2]
MFSRHRFSGGWERSHAGLKQEEMGAIALRLKRAIERVINR